MSEPLNFGIIGTGGIAGDFAQALSRSKLCRVVNVVGSSPEKGQTFAKKFGLPASSGSLDQFLADKNVQAVYVATPHPAHEAQAIACIEAKKHVLCEKPMTMDLAGAERVVAAAKKHGVFLMEAFMYRCHPLMKELIERLKGGVIGDIRHVRADFSFRVPRDPKGRLFDVKLGGGGILDVGGYPVSFARLVAGLVAGKPFAEPTKIQAVGYRGPTGADEIASALLSFESGFQRQRLVRGASRRRPNHAGVRREGTHRNQRSLDPRRRSAGARNRLYDPPRRQGPRARADSHRRRDVRHRSRARRRDAPRARRPVARNELGRHPRQHARARRVAGRNTIIVSNRRASRTKGKAS